MAIRRYTPSDLINIQNPVNRNSPLNRGLDAWWLTIPKIIGGGQFYDLMGLYSGTLVSMTAAASGWKRTTRIGGYGHLSCDAVGYVTTNYAKQLNDFSCGCWYNFKATSGAATRVLDKKFQTGFWLGRNIANTANTMICGVVESGTFGTDFASTDNVWHRFYVVRKGTVKNLYLDGLLISSTTVPSTALSNSTFRLGADDTNATKGAAWIDDVKIYSRALNDSEVKWDYDDSRTGYPETLNRYSRTFAGFSTSGLLLERRRKLVG